MGEWYWEMDAAGRLTCSSEHCLRMLGRNPAELLGHSPVEFAAPDDDGAPAAVPAAAHRHPARGPIRVFEG